MTICAAARLSESERAADDEVAQLRKRIERLEALLATRIEALDHP
jgi:hypothetical protein